VAPPPAPSLVIQLRLDTRLPGVAVEVTARGDGTPLSTWSIAAPDADAFHLDEARDDRGPFTPSLARRGGGLVLTLDRPAEGGVHVRYTVAARSRPASQAITVDADPNRFLASGEALLLLPEAFEDRAVPASIRVDPAPDDEHLGAASSFGFGLAREVTARGRDLRFATFLAGPSVGHALFDTLEGRDEAVWLGYTSFDPRPIAADVAAFRTAARELFRERSAEPHTLIIATDARPVGAFLASRRASSVLVRVGVGEPWSAPVRIAVAAEVLHAWIGGRLWIGPDDPAHEAEAYWFSEGLTRGFARDLLFRFGLVTPVELLDELHGLAAVVATSPYRGEGNAALAAHVHAPGALSLVVARGALYAARVDALVRARSGGKRRLDDVLRALYERAREKRGPLPASAWIEAITAELGPAEGDVFAATTRDGRPPEIPEGAFGPCFRGEKRRYQAFDPGFDEEATRAASEKVIQGLRAAGPAERAGLRGGDVLVDARLTRGRGDLPATLTITRDGEAKTLRYLPAGARADGQGWARRKDVGDEACAR
jgi:predicted metalloprotease with PDZ domain